MINFISGFIVGGTIVYLFLEVFLKVSKKEPEILHSVQDDKQDQSQSQQEVAKHGNMQKLREYIATSDGKITNNQVEKMLGVSSATSERYLNELEHLGLIRQVGVTGVNTYYEKV